MIAIIGVLLGLLMPAVQMSREAARRSACANNLRQQAIAVKLHQQSHGIYPTGGWGPNWVGDPDACFSPKQPGGWIYNVLPYLEQAALRELGKGLPVQAKRQAAVKLLETPVVVLNCPSRRPSELYSYTGPRPLENVDPPAAVAKADYAINVKISYAKSEVIVSEIQLTQGLSKTLLVGGKAVFREHYSDGQASGDMLSMYAGDCEDIRRSVADAPTSDAQASGFGSAHPSGCNVAMGDGSVRFVGFDDKLELH